MTIARNIAGRKGSRGAAFGLALSLALITAPALAAPLRVSWASNNEADLAGYRLRYGTSPGAYIETIEAGLANSCEVPGLEAGRTYHLALFAYDTTGNESAPSGEITARIPPSLAAIPVVESAAELGSRSLFAVKGRASLVTVYGEHFQAGASIDFGPGITVGTPALTTTGNLIARLDVAPSATLGNRTVTVTNPDQGIGSRSDTLAIVKNPDVNTDCAVDVLDLNVLARAWNETGEEARYLSEVDFDDDGYVGPEDLTIFVQYFGRVYAGCP